MFDEEGKIESDPSPKEWDELDWAVYETFGYPREISFVRAGQILDVPWTTVKYRYERILQQCRVLNCFFPLGHAGYHYIVLTFGTKYETGLVRALQRIDRTTYIYKFRGTILLILFLLPHPLSYNKAGDRFKELEEMGIIHDLRVSIPIRWWKPTFNLKEESPNPV